MNKELTTAWDELVKVYILTLHDYDFQKLDRKCRMNELVVDYTLTDGNGHVYSYEVPDIIAVRTADELTATITAQFKRQREIFTTAN